MSTPLFLAIDGGNSKTHVVLGDATGRVHAVVHGGTSSPHVLGLPGSLRVLDDLVARARSGFAAEPVAQASVFLAGADLPVEVERLTAEVAALGWAARSVVDNDTFALLRAGTDQREAIAVVCGAGTNCVGRRADGRIARFPALGPYSGDWGGGHHLAAKALYYAARGEDGRGAPTALTAAVIDHFGLPTVEEAGIALHLGQAPIERMHTLSEVLFAVADAGDPVACAVVQRQADEVVALSRVAATRLDLLAERHAVVLGGGVLAARHTLLHEAILAGIAANEPCADVTVATDAPVVGAALLALDDLHGASATPPDIERTLREAFPAHEPALAS